LIVAPSVESWLKSLPHGAAEDQPVSLFDQAVRPHKQRQDELIKNQGDENPYKLHQELGEWMTTNVTVVRNNKDIQATLDKIGEFEERYENVALSDKSNWTNQNLSFTRALGDMIALARLTAKGALLRNECRGAHYKPEFDIPAPTSDDPAELRRQAETWCRTFREKNEQWLRTTIARYKPDGPEIGYEAVDTSLIPPRPRTYGLKGAEIIEEVWRTMQGERSKREGEAVADDRSPRTAVRGL
jgi:succinate dehydrogenase / fumarate reductase flavoprotein subunit